MFLFFIKFFFKDCYLERSDFSNSLFIKLRSKELKLSNMRLAINRSKRNFWGIIKYEIVKFLGNIKYGIY